MTFLKSQRSSKLASIEEAVSHVKDGMTVSIGGIHSHEAPAAFVREIVRKGLKDLTLVPTNACGYQGDILIGAGAVRTLYNSYSGLDYLGAAPNFRRFAEAGRLDVVEFEEMGLCRGINASTAGVNFFPLPDGFLGVDVWKVNPEFYKVIEDPFTGKRTVVVKPIRPNICIIHVPWCDEFGNGIELGVPDLLHTAADYVIVTADEIVPPEFIQRRHREVTVLGQFVGKVVHVPFGAHPGQCAGHYVNDERHLKEYQLAAKDDVSFNAYLDKYVRGKDQDSYLNTVGLEHLAELKQRGAIK